MFTRAWIPPPAASKGQALKFLQVIGADRAVQAAIKSDERKAFRIITGKAETAVGQGVYIEFRCGLTGNKHCLVPLVIGFFGLTPSRPLSTIQLDNTVQKNTLCS